MNAEELKELQEYWKNYKEENTKPEKELSEAEKFWLEMGHDISDIIYYSSPDPDSDEEMILRGFQKLSPEFQEKFKSAIEYMSAKHKIDLTIADNAEDVREYIRSKKEIEELEKIHSINQDIETINNVINEFPNDLSINPEFESSKLKLTHVVYDIEAGQNSEPIAIGIYNYEAKRITIAKKSTNGKILFKEYLQENGLILQYLETPYLYEALLLNDVETVIGAILLSALHQGHKNISTIFEHYKICYVNTKLLEEILMHQRKSIYIAHNSTKYDLPQLSNEYKQHKHKLHFFAKFTPETIKITETYSEKGFTIYLGNQKIGFRFEISHRKRNIQAPNIKISPLQREAYPLNFNVDTLIFARSIQYSQPLSRPGECLCEDKNNDEHENNLHIYTFESYSLEALSSHSPFAKKHLETEKKAFKLSDFENPAKTLTKSTEYLIYDLFSNLIVYETLTNHVKLSSFEKITNSKIQPRITPLAQKLHSTATISKEVLFAKLEKDTKLDRYQIEKNIKSERIFQKNFENTYLGGMVETYCFGHISSDDEQEIFYYDFASLYPHSAWIMEAYELYKLSAQGKLHLHIINDTLRGVKNIKARVENIVRKLKSLQAIEKEDLNFIGNMTFYSDIPLLLRTTRSKGSNKSIRRRMDSYVKGQITTTIPDFIMSIVEYHFRTGKPLRKIFQMINIRRVEFVELPANNAYGDEFFSQLYLNRREIKKQMAQLKKNNKEDLYTYHELNSQQHLAKIVMNAGYGIASEGISVEDHTGILFNPVIASGITSIARSLMRLAFIISRHLGATPIYSDTDSLIFKSDKETANKIQQIFKKTSEFENEFKDKKIMRIYVAGKKKYALQFEDGSIYMKVHAISQYPRQESSLMLEYAYRQLFAGNYNYSEIAKKTAKYHPLYLFIRLARKRDPKVKGLMKFNNGEIVYSYDYHGVNMNIIYLEENDSFLVTNVEKVKLGQFGQYLNGTRRRQKGKLMFWLSTPIPTSFDDFIEHFIDTFYFDDMDAIFKTMPERTKWERLYKYIIEQLHEFNTTGGQTSLDPDSLHEEFGYYLKRIHKILNIPYLDSKKNNFLYLFEHLRDYGTEELKKAIPKQILNRLITPMISFLDYELSIQKELLEMFEYSEHPAYEIYHSIIETVYEPKLKKQLSNNGFRGLIMNREINFRGLEHKIKLLIDFYNKREDFRKKIIKYFSFDKDKVLRYIAQTIKNINEYYHITEVFSEKRKDPIILNYTAKLQKKIDVDGFSYTFTMPLPTYDFSNDLRANIDKYYSRNILNLAITASKIYYQTHYPSKVPCAYLTQEGYVEHDNNCNSQKCKISQYYYMDKKQLPTPKKDRAVLIPLKFTVIPKIIDIDGKPYIRHEDAELMDQHILDRFSEKEWLTYDVRRKLYRVENLKKLESYIFLTRKREWVELDIYGHLFSVSIEKYNSFNYTGILAISILPEKVDYTKKRVMKAILRINPTSHNLLNLKLFKTSISQLLHERNKLSIFLQTLLQDTDLQFFERNHAITREHFLEKPHLVNSAIYQTFLKEKMWRLSKHINVTLTEVSETQQITMKELIPNFKKTHSFPILAILQQAMIEKAQALRPLDAKFYIEDKKKFQIFPHRSSTGITAINYENKASMTIYIKNKEWYENKIMRNAHRKDIPARITKKVLETPFEPTLRFEVAMFGLNSILTTESEDILNRTRKFVFKYFRSMNDLFREKFLQRYEEMKEEVPSEFVERTALEYVSLGDPPPIS